MDNKPSIIRNHAGFSEGDVMKSFEDEKKEMLSNSKMMSDSAFPVTIELQYSSRPEVGFRSTSKGISKREYFAAMAMQGLATKEEIQATDGWNRDRKESCARYAVNMADALIAELNKEQK